MAPLPPKLSALLEEMRQMDEHTRYDLLIEYAERFEDVDPQIATRPFSKKHRVPGCESEAYIWASDLPGNSTKFHFAVENPQGISAKALAVILDETLSGESKISIQAIPADLVYTLFGRTLSMGKGQGLMGMVEMVKFLSK